MTEHVFRPKRRVNGKLRIGRTYSGRYRLAGDSRIITVPLGVSDKGVAKEKLRKILVEAEREREGLIAPKIQRDVTALPLIDHACAYCDSRRAIRCDEKYVRELERKLRKMIDECSWGSVRQVTSESFEAWRAKQTKSPKTLNEYLNAVSGLMNWLEPRVGANPLRFVQRVQNGAVPQRERRAFTFDELQRLVNVSGERGVVYLAAARTGLRRGELEQLRWSDIHFDTPQPFVNVRANISKNHKQAQIPLAPDAAAALCRLHQAGVTADAVVFYRLMPRMNRFREDLAAAGISYVDAKGEYADFHSLRKTFGTMLTLAGELPRNVMELMRHSDMRLTAKTYTDANMLPLSAAIAKLPQIRLGTNDTAIGTPPTVISSPTVSATVPLEAGKPNLLTTGEQTFSPSESASVRVSPEVEENARCRVRTCDLSPRRPL